MRLTFTATDIDPGHVLEAAIDVVEIYDASPLKTDDSLMAEATLMAAPNPFTGATNLYFYYKGQPGGAQVLVYDLQGRLKEQVEVKDNNGFVSLAGQLPAGAYIAVFSVNGRPLAQQKIVKIK
jgi:hypothetical protein